MAPVDATLRYFIIHRLLPVLVIIILIYSSRKRFKKLLRMFSTWLNNMIGLKSNKLFGTEKTKLFAFLHDQTAELDRNLQILEIGAGGGINMKYYPKGTEIVCIDPNPNFESYIKEKADATNVTLKAFVRGFAENMDQIADDSCDAVVSTLVLCSVNEPQAVLSEIRRVLKPGGKFFFLEHVSGEEGSCVKRFQRGVNPLWRFVTDGCNVNRETWTHIENAGFSKVNLKKMTAPSYLGCCVPLRPFIIGTAEK